MTTDIKAELFASKVYGDISPRLEKLLERNATITRSSIEQAVRRELFRTAYQMDERMVSYLTESLAGSYIG